MGFNKAKYCVCKLYISLKCVLMFITYMHNYCICKNITTLFDYKGNIEIPIYSCFNWYEILNNWKICICYILSSGCNLNYISLGDIRLFCSVTKLMQDILWYYRFSMSLTPASVNIISGYPIVCLVCSTMSYSNIDLLLNGISNMTLVVLRINIKLVALLCIMFSKAKRNGLKLQFIDSSFERIINITNKGNYFSLGVFIDNYWLLT